MLRSDYISWLKEFGLTSLSFLLVVFDGWIDRLLLFPSCPTLERLPLVEQYVSWLHLFQYWYLKYKGFRSMEYVFSKMVDELTRNASSFAGLSVNVFVDLSVDYFCFRILKMKFICWSLLWLTVIPLLFISIWKIYHLCIVSTLLFCLWCTDKYVLLQIFP